MRLVEALLLILTILYVLTFGLLSKNMNHFNGHITIQSQSPASLGKPEETDSFESANRQSFGFFYDIPESNWKRLQQIFNEHVNHLHPEKPFVYHPQSQEHQSIPQVYVNRRGHSGWNSYAAWYQSNYEPNFSCPFERRIGGTGQSGCVTLIEYANLQRREEQKILVILDVLCILLDLMVTFRLSWVSAI